VKFLRDCPENSPELPFMGTQKALFRIPRIGGGTLWEGGAQLIAHLAIEPGKEQSWSR